MSRPRPLALVRILAIAVLLGLLLYAYLFADWRPRSLSDLEREFRLLGDAAPISAVLLQVVLAIVFVPGMLVMAATALIFGVDSIWINFAGQTVGACVCYALGRYVGHEFVRGLLGQRVLILERVLEDHAFRYLVYLHFLWLIPVPFLTYGPGLLRVRFPHFLAATAIGVAPFCIVFGLFARGLSQIRRPADALQAEFVLPAAFLLVLGIVPLTALALVRRRKRRKAARPAPVEA